MAHGLRLHHNPLTARERCLCIDLVPHHLDNRPSQPTYVPESITTRLISDVAPFLSVGEAPSGRIPQALRIVEQEIRSGGSIPGQILGLAILRFKLDDEERPLFIVEMPEFTNVQEDVGAYNPDWEAELRGALRV